MPVRGGAVFVGQSVRLSVERCSFEGTNAHRGGGAPTAPLIPHPFPSPIHTPPPHHSPTPHRLPAPAAIYADAFSIAVLSASDFRSCFAYLLGGAVYAGSGAVLALIDAAFTANEAVNAGGAVFADSSSKVFAVSSSAAEGAEGAGGAEGPAAKDEAEPWAGAGRGAGAAGTCAALPRCQFRRNAASGSLGSGGAVHLNTAAFLWFHGCCLEGNSAVSGGAVFSAGARGRRACALLSPLLPNACCAGPITPPNTLPSALPPYGRRLVDADQRGVRPQRHRPAPALPPPVPRRRPRVARLPLPRGARPGGGGLDRRRRQQQLRHEPREPRALGGARPTSPRTRGGLPFLMRAASRGFQCS